MITTYPVLDIILGYPKWVVDGTEEVSRQFAVSLLENAEGVVSAITTDFKGFNIYSKALSEEEIQIKEL